VLLESGADPKNMLPQIRQLLAQRQAMGGHVSGTYARQGPGGGFALFNAAGPASAA